MVRQHQPGQIDRCTAIVLELVGTVSLNRSFRLTGACAHGEIRNAPAVVLKFGRNKQRIGSLLAERGKGRLEFIRVAKLGTKERDA